MLLLTETWSAAFCWFSDRTISSIVRPDSESRCSIQVRGNARAVLCPCSRRANSATKELTIGGSDRAMSAVSNIRLFGSFSEITTICSAQRAARSRSMEPAATRAPTRRRFSISARRSMMGMAHNSPSVRTVTFW